MVLGGAALSYERGIPLVGLASYFRAAQHFSTCELHPVGTDDV